MCLPRGKRQVEARGAKAGPENPQVRRATETSLKGGAAPTCDVLSGDDGIEVHGVQVRHSDLPSLPLQGLYRSLLHGMVEGCLLCVGQYDQCSSGYSGTHKAQGKNQLPSSKALATGRPSQDP